MIEAPGSYQRGLRQSIDWKLIICYLLLVLIGIANIYAAIHTSDNVSFFAWESRSGKQLIWIGTALVLATLILFVMPARWWEGLSLPLYLFVLLLLVAVIFLGVEVKGSRSWFAFGPVRFQPAEISKISTSLLLAAVMSRTDFNIRKFKNLALAGAILLIPMLVILGESETGSALVYVGFIFVLYREGLSGWWLALIGLAIALFITTLTLSPFHSILFLVAVVGITYSFQGTRKQFRPRFLITAGFVLVMSLVPWILRLIDLSILKDQLAILTEYYVPRAGEVRHASGEFLLRIKPVHIITVTSLLAIPPLALLAYRQRDRALWLTIGAFIVGAVLVFSSDYIFDEVLQDHQRSRIEVLLGLKEDPSGVGYNQNQSKIAIGSGGLAGKGWLGGTQTTYGFVPEQSTDFIFCTVGEQFGFLGCLLVIALYVFLIVRILMDAERCRSPFTRIYGYCVAACIFMHLFINIGMTLGLMPVIGIPLPLLSYGGSSLWAFTILIFIFIALYRDEKKYF